MNNTQNHKDADVEKGNPDLDVVYVKISTCQFEKMIDKLQKYESIVRRSRETYRKKMEKLEGKKFEGRIEFLPLKISILDPEKAREAKVVKQIDCVY